MRHKNVLLGLLAIMVVLSVVVLTPYVRPILAGLILGFIFLPVYLFMKRIVRFDWLASIIVIVCMILFFMIPIALSGSLLISEIQIFAEASETGIAELVESIGSLPLPQFFAEADTTQTVKVYLTGAVQTLTLRATQNLDRVFINVFHIVLYLTVFLFTIYYYFKDRERLNKAVRTLAHNSLNHEDAKKLDVYFGRVGITLNAVVRGTIITSLVQAALLIPAYYFVGLSTPLLWALLTFFIAVMPVVGAPVVWVPLFTIKAIQAVLVGDLFGLIVIIGAGLWAMLVVSNIDNIIRPAIIGKDVQVHPYLVLVGILGGISVFGAIGIFIGPVILTATLQFYTTFFVERHSPA